jgi:hypothetical protein
MTPIAAYYIFTAAEHERAAASAHQQLVRRHRPSLLDRVRTLAALIRPQASHPRPA